MYQPVCYGTFWWSGRTVVTWKPCRPLQFAFLYVYFSALVFCSETEHQLGGKRPTLTAEISDVTDGNACLFHYLTPYRLLGRLSCLHEACYTGVVFGDTVAVQGQQNVVSAVYKHDYAGFYPWEYDVVAVWAHKRGFLLICAGFQPRAALRTIACLAEPFV